MAKIDEMSDVLSVEDVMEILHVGRNAVYGMLKDKTLASMKLGKKYIIPKRSVIKLLSNIMEE